MSAPVDPSHRRQPARPDPFDPSQLGPSDVVTDRRVAEAYVASVCFKHGPPRLLGTELEWLVRDAADPARRLDLASVLRALGPHAPTTARRPGSGPLPETPPPPTPLPRGGLVTLEPGGQVEIASPPLDTLAELIDAVGHDVAEVRRRLAGEGLTLLRRAGDPVRPPRRVLDVPRYAAMEAAFDRIGPYGRTMMCSTAAVQVCVDAGADDREIAARWAALHEIGPTLTAAFANSPAVHGRRTGWKSSRMASWLSLDPARTSPPPVTGPDPAGEYARRALDTTLMCVRTGDHPWTAPGQLTFADWIDGGLEQAPTRADLDVHLTTLFPPVRPQGHLEVRYIDQQPGDEWIVPIAVVAAVTADPATVDRARAAVAPAVGRWAAAARHGLADRVLRRCAGDLFELAHRRLAGAGFADPTGGAGSPTVDSVAGMVAGVIERRVLAGRCPADDPVGEPGEPSAPVAGPGPDLDEPRDAGDLPAVPDPLNVPDHPFPIAGGDPS